jgi:hypothetical protein
MPARSSARRHGLPWTVLGGGSLLGLLLFARCFSPSLPTCSYRCDTAERACPPEYECRSDAICHLKGSSEACSFVVDLGGSAPDLASPRDLQSGSDLGDM